LCGPGWPPERTGEPAGSTAMILNEGLRGLSTSPTPVIVPPVPMPETTMSTLPSVSFQISSAVVRRWMAGLDGLENCWRMTLFGILAASSSALAIAPFMPFAPSVRTRRAPRTLRILRRSVVIVSGIVRMSFRPRAAATNASAMPVLPLVGSIRTVSLLMRSALQGVVDHREADAVLDARERVEELELEEDLRLRAVGGRRPVEAHERRVADRFGDVVVYLGHVYCGLSFGFGKKGRGLDRVVLVEGVGLPAGAGGRGR
jgi:hypothetical protein